MIQATLRTCFALVLGTFTITALLPVPRAKAQSPSPFLVSPYYGTGRSRLRVMGQTIKPMTLVCPTSGSWLQPVEPQT